MTEERIDQSLKLFITLSRAYKVLMEEGSSVFEREGLNSTEFAVLELLYHKGPQPIQKIGQKILMQSGSMTYVINQLQKKELLVRERCTEDRRVFYVQNTAAGDALIERIFPEHAALIASLTNGLTIDEMEQLSALLKKLGLAVRPL